MKRLAILICMFMFVGCATIEYEGFKYSRFGNQELIDVSIEQHSADGSSVKATLGKQQSERIAVMLETILQMIDLNCPGETP